MSRYRPPSKPSSKVITPEGYQALREELDVEPSDRTKQLYEQIRSDNLKLFVTAGDKMASRPVRLVLLHSTENFPRRVTFQSDINSPWPALRWPKHDSMRFARGYGVLDVA